MTYSWAGFELKSENLAVQSLPFFTSLGLFLGVASVLLFFCMVKWFAFGLDNDEHKHFFFFFYNGGLHNEAKREMESLAFVESLAWKEEIIMIEREQCG